MAKKIPNIRFNGFDEEWEEKKLESLGKWDRGQQLSKSDISPSGKNPCIHYGELFAYDEIITKVHSKTDLEPISTSSGNDILFPDSDVTPDGLGRSSALLQKNVILGGGINILRVVENDASFCSLNITKNKKQIIERVTGSTVRHIHSKDLNEVSIFVSPIIHEQQKIGEFFRQLDELISAKEEELAKLRQIKSALLDAMFPSDEQEANRGGV